MIKAILFDISGVLYMDQSPIVGAVDVINQLQQSGVPLRFVTNSSRSTQSMILKKLIDMGFDIHKEQVFSAPIAVKQTLQQRKLRPYCLIHPSLEDEFSDLEQTMPNAVVVGDAADRFDYEHMNSAFELLIDGAPLIGVGRNRYFKSHGKLCLDAGPFIKALEYATGIEAEIMGKPSPSFFEAALHSLNCRADEAIMIGDDAESDVEAALNVGMHACLVQTGKYRIGDENLITLSGAQLTPSVVEAVDMILPTLTH